MKWLCGEFVGTHVSLARKIGLECAVIVNAMLCRQDKKIDDFINFVTSLGVERPSHCRDNLLKLKILVKDDDSDQYKIDTSSLDILFEEPVFFKAGRSNKCIMSIKAWITWLKSKGIIKKLEDVISEWKNYSDEEIISAVKYSRDNGFKSIFFGEKFKRTNEGAGNSRKLISAGSKLNSNIPKDYSERIKTAGE